MKKLTVLLLLLATVLSGCARKETPQIATTTLPVYEFTNMLCVGTDLTVSRLVTESVSCIHDYALQVSQVRAIEGANVIIINGGGLEEFLDDALRGRNNVIDASSGVEFTCGHTHNHDENHHEYDPHIWLSPNYAKQMCKNICQELSTLYSQNADQFASNLAALLEQLDTLQSYGEQELSGLVCENLITFHDGFSYFADSFGLHILKAVEEESGSEASAKDLIELIDLVNTHKLPAIFTESNGSTAAAEIIARETGVKIYTLDMAMSGDSYFDAMYHNIDTIKEALG